MLTSTVMHAARDDSTHAYHFLLILLRIAEQVAAVSTATECLKSYVLRRQPNGAYAVNFRPDVWVVMQEARYLDQLGMREAPAAVLNVALHKVSIMGSCLRHYGGFQWELLVAWGPDRDFVGMLTGQERFCQHQVLLEGLVDKLNSTLSSILPAHKSLLSRQIAELHRQALAN